MSDWSVAVLMIAGVVSNLVAIYCLDHSDGMTKWVPTIVLAVTILFTQKCISIVIHRDHLATAAGGAAKSGGWSLGPTIGVLLIVLLVGSAIMGRTLGKDPAPTPLQWAGYATAVAGIALVKFGA